MLMEMYRVQYAVPRIWFQCGTHYDNTVYAIPDDRQRTLSLEAEITRQAVYVHRSIKVRSCNNFFFEKKK
jgi:hypothetical protein